MAKGAADRFHAQLADGDDDAIYQEADRAYKRSVTKEASHQLMVRVRRRMGQIQRAEYQSFLMSEATDGTFITLRYNTKFSNGDLEEEFTFRIDQGRATLVRYEASSPNLLAE